MLFVIDRFEGDFAVVELETGETINLPRSVLPDGAREGQVFRIVRDENEETRRAERIKKLMDGLFN